MNGDTMTNESLMHGRIDGLVCGELAEEERRELLEWLDADVARWRTCGLAFLEAQVWQETLGQEEGVKTHGSGVKAQKSEVSRGQFPSNSPRRNSPAPPWLTPLVAVAAVIAAFACGLGWREMLALPQPDGAIVDRSQPAKQLDRQSPGPGNGPLLASVPVTGGPLGKMEAVLQFPVLLPEAAKGQAAASSVPEHIRRQWERRGYELKEERRYLPARLPDGQQVMVPVNEVKMKFVGRPVS